MPVYPASPYERPDSGNRQAQTKAERRAEHNAIERARRESLNGKFQQLAFTLPNLQNDTRPSKSTIIDRTLDFVKNAIAKEERYQRRIQELEKFNSYLLAQSEQRLQKKQVKKVNTKNLPEMIPQADNLADSSSDEEDEEDQEEHQETAEDNHQILKREQEQTLFIPSSIATTTSCNSSSSSITSVTGVHNPNQLINSVSQSSVNMMPKISYAPNWTTSSAVTDANYQPHLSFFQPSLITPKFQNLSKLEHNPQEQFLLNNNNANFMLNTETEQNFHHLMHRR